MLFTDNFDYGTLLNEFARGILGNYDVLVGSLICTWQPISMLFVRATKFLLIF